MLCGSQRWATLQTRLSGNSLPPAGATHFRSCSQYRPPGCCLSSQKTSSASCRCISPATPSLSLQILACLCMVGLHVRLRLPLLSARALATCGVAASRQRRHLRKRSQFPCLLYQRATSALAQCRARRQIAIASRRCRHRQRRACDSTQSVTETLVLLNLERTLNFDAGCAEPQPRLLAAQAGGLACCANLPEFNCGLARPTSPGLRCHFVRVPCPLQFGRSLATFGYC